MTFRVVQGDIEIAVAQHRQPPLAINAACQQAGAGMDRLRFAPQRDRRGEAVKPISIIEPLEKAGLKVFGFSPSR